MHPSLIVRHRCVFTLAVGAALLSVGLLGCEPDDSESSVGATCQSTCEKSVALQCPNDPSTVDACVSQCESQIAGCSDPSIVQAYLDCAQTTPMECGDTTGQASSPECVQQGLAYFACLNGITPDMTGGDTADSDVTEDDADTGAGDDTAMPGAVDFVATINGVEATFQQGPTVVNDVPGLDPGSVYTSFTGQVGGAGSDTIIITFPGAAPGTFVCGTDNHARVQYTDRRESFEFVGGDTDRGGTCTLEVTEVGAPGGMIRGTFEATVSGPDSSGNTVDFTITDGRFAVVRPTE